MYSLHKIEHDATVYFMCTLSVFDLFLFAFCVDRPEILSSTDAKVTSDPDKHGR